MKAQKTSGFLSKCLKACGDGLALVRSYLETVDMIKPRLALMEEAATTGESPRLLAELVERYGFSYSFFELRDFGAIQLKRRRLIAWHRRVDRGL
jgi:hypothetical protein